MYINNNKINADINTSGQQNSSGVNTAKAQQKSQSIFMEDINSKIKPLNIEENKFNELTKTAENIFAKYDTDGIAGWSTKEEAKATNALKRFWNSIIKYLQKNDNTENQWSSNGKIESAEQGRIGDCWLLAQVNSLSETDYGKQAIKDAIIKNSDGSYTIQLKGIGDKYDISAEEIITARASKKYSTGDLDVLLLELALEKHFEKYDRKVDEFELSIDGGNPVYPDDDSDKGNITDISFLLTGIKTQSMTDEMDFILKLKAQNPDAISVPIAVTKDPETGEQFESNLHLCHVKSVQMDDNGNIISVTIINPWDNNKEIVKSYDEFKEMVSMLAYSSKDSKMNEVINQRLEEAVAEKEKALLSGTNLEDFLESLCELSSIKRNKLLEKSSVEDMYKKFCELEDGKNTISSIVQFLVYLGIPLGDEYEQLDEKGKTEYLMKLRNEPDFFKQHCQSKGIKM